MPDPDPEIKEEGEGAGLQKSFSAWLFLSVVLVTGSVHLYVNVTCFAAKHLKFDSRYTTVANITLKVYFIDLFFS